MVGVVTISLGRSLESSLSEVEGTAAGALACLDFPGYGVTGFFFFPLFGEAVSTFNFTDFFSPRTTGGLLCPGLLLCLLVSLISLYVTLVVGRPPLILGLPGIIPLLSSPFETPPLPLHQRTNTF